MLLRFLYLAVAFGAALLSYQAFLSFQDRRQRASQFEDFYRSAPIEVRHLWVSPQSLNVDAWNVGSAAVYRLRDARRDKLISYQIATLNADRTDEKWLIADNVSEFYGRGLAVGRLVSENDIRLGSEVRASLLSSNLFPLPLGKYRPAPPYSIFFEALGKEMVITDSSEFNADHYFVYITSPEGKPQPFLELWVDPDVRPLGIVKARWRDQFLELVEANENLSQKPPLDILTYPQGSKARRRNCLSCHESSGEGRDLEVTSPYFLTGTHLNIKEALYHFRQARLVDESNSLALSVRQEDGEARAGGSIRFNTKMGSFAIKMAPTARSLSIKLDEKAHQACITLSSGLGRVGLFLGLGRSD